MNKSLLMILGMFILVAGCAHRQKVLDVAGASNTKYNIKRGYVLKEIGEVEGKFCVDTMKDSGDIGLLDNALNDAHKKNKADFFTNVTVWKEGANCFVVTGLAHKQIRKRRRKK